MLRLLLLLASLSIAVMSSNVWGAEAKLDSANPEHIRFFETSIRPLLAEHCWKCHGEKSQKGSLRLDSLAGILRGGDSGAAIVPGQVDESLLIEAVHYDGYEMPPKGPLNKDQIEALETWVRIGAPWPGASAKDLRLPSPDKTPTFSDEDRQWWAIAPLSQPAVPATAGAHWAINEIDHFIANQQDKQGLAPAPPASRETLIRRVSFDLTGLPPTRLQIDQFLADTSDQAYESLVDRLLESPAYGERFARHWLDVARYADSDGYRADHLRPDAWRYRDYVIKSFNADKPYDRFVKEQIAGDELYPNDPDARIATGFLTHGIYEYNSRDAVGQWDMMLNEITDTLGDVFLGVGMQCSRCHDHKFDPVLQRDYFALRAFVEPILLDRDAVCATQQQRSEYAAAEAKWLAATESIRAQLDPLESKYRKKAETVAVIKFPLSVQAMYNKPESEKTPHELQISELVWRQVEFEYERMDQKFSDTDKETILRLRRELAQFDHLKPAALPVAQSVRDACASAPLTVIPKKRTEVEPAFLSILNVSQPTEFGQTLVSTDQSPQATSTGRRSQLANWVADASNPLSTRVIVNRIWQTHFGRGLAPNASDFGFLGGPPTHPELLDWLTGRFIEEGWQLKPLHRLIVTSATYRQSSLHPQMEAFSVIDPTNQWYWRGDVRRLDAEQIRDAILAVSDRLNDQAGGPAASDDKLRRSIYTVVTRNSRNPLLDAFDLPLFFSSSAARDTTTNPLQSLMLINSQAMLDHAKEFSRRVDDQQPAAAIDQLWQLAFGRDPSDAERQSAQTFLATQQSRYSQPSAPDQNDLQTSILPYRNGSSIVIKPDGQAIPRSQPHPGIQTDEFTIETIFQLGSVYESGAVRSIVSTAPAKQGAAGWTFGVTGKGSRRKPQTLVLHVYGNNGKSKTAEAAVFSDQHVDLGKPYYAAATFRLSADGKPGSVTFYLQDLSDDEQPMSIATMEHDLIGGLGGDAGIAIGGRINGNNGVFDGLIDDVRFSSGILDDEALLLRDESSTKVTIGHWKFDPAAGLLKDQSEQQIDLQLGRGDEITETPQRRALADLCHVLLNSSEFLYVQ
ncbi:DUF1553 domain-containing protein [Stieleria sp. TO1_6]|uniref:DUF1553 domain-containing protein n=1 Tax=Stieleria tagensis TaxID=2956795 RepID=UPI00209BAA77|nr:DUF1553 domain-containing protein [Stieleria tagensis]MCO8120583.1 DUF1553 domain-containing protein [Stieleria tagensis]